MTFNTASNRLANADRERIAQDERIAARLDEVIRRTPRKQFQGIIQTDASGRPLETVSRAMVEEVDKDIRKRLNGGARGEPRIMGIDARTGRLKLSDAMYEAMVEGRFCPNCIQAQEDPSTPECGIKGKSYGCGYRRGLSGV